MNNKLYHLPVEPYQARMTESLLHWESRAFKENGFEVETILPDEANSSIAMNIHSGEVLDAVNRPVTGLKQFAELMPKLAREPVPPVIYCSDFYTTGLDALPYSRLGYRAFAFLWAQTFDVHDFTYSHHRYWMRPWEVMALEIYEKVFVASEGLRELIAVAVPEFSHKVEVVGLPFDCEAVAAAADYTFTPDGPIDVVYSSRFDSEKRPDLFLDLVEGRPDLRFAVCTGHPELKGTDKGSVHRAQILSDHGKLRIYKDLKKGQYYSILRQATVQMNFAEQDWVSFTLLEALMFGCLPLYPNFRSFPETLNYNQDFLYQPGNMRDASEHLSFLLAEKKNIDTTDLTAISEYHNDTLNRISTIIKHG